MTQLEILCEIFTMPSSTQASTRDRRPEGGAYAEAGLTGSCGAHVRGRAGYEQVLRAGTDDDIRYFIDVDQLQQLWTRLWLARRVRAA